MGGRKEAMGGRRGGHVLWRRVKAGGGRREGKGPGQITGVEVRVG